MDAQHRFAPTLPAVRIQPMSQLGGGTSMQFADWQQQQQQQQQDDEDEEDEKRLDMMMPAEESDNGPAA